MTIYAETVFLSNFFIDLFLLSFTLAVIKKKVSVKRLVCSAVFGGITSTIYPLIGSIRYAIKALCVLVMVIIIKPGKHVKDYAVTVVTLLAATFLLGGAVTFFVDFFRADLRYENFTYGIIHIFVSASCTGIIYLTDILKTELGKFRRKNSLFSVVRIKSGSFNKKCRAFYDSGNRVYADNGEPVIFVGEKIYNNLAPDEDKTSSVEIITANGISILPTKEATVEVYSAGGSHTIYKVAAGKVSAACLSEAEILLHSDMQGEFYL